GTLSQAPVFGAGAFPLSLAVGDFNGDGAPDLATVYSAVSGGSVLLGGGHGAFCLQRGFGVGRDPLSVAVGDFNGDGKPDLAVANSGSSTVSVLLGNGDGTFSAPLTFEAGTSPCEPRVEVCSLAVGDFNGDGKPDLVTAHSGEVSVLLG